MFSELAKNAAKRLLYAVKKPQLPEQLDLSLGYVIHTELVYDLDCFNRLVRFCKTYNELTGRRAICTVMSGVNPRVEGGRRRHGVSLSDFAERLHTLSEHATLGYHGHFWLDPARVREREALITADTFHSMELELRCNNFIEAPLVTQLTDDLNWFKSAGIELNGVYAGGWWFMNRVLMGLLIERGFRYDFTFSYSPWFRNEYSAMLLESNQVPPGTPFVIRREAAKMLCVQMLIGAHQTPFVDDFRRVLAKVIKGQKQVFGVVGAHDYDLDFENTVACLRELKSVNSAKFFGFEQLNEGAAGSRLLSFDWQRC